jgi:hypothetical protein
MEETLDPPTARTMLYETVVELLEMEFPSVSGATLESIFRNCKWRLKKGDPITKVIEEARRLIAADQETIGRQVL